MSTALTLITPIAQRVREAAKKIPVNALGLLEGIYRPDLLPETIQATHKAGVDTLEASEGTTAPTTAVTIIDPSGKEFAVQSEYDKELRNAYVPMDYEEGYPTLDGKPFWSQLLFEPSDAFQCFQLYLSQAKDIKSAKGIRQIHLLLEEQTIRLQKITLEQLHDFYHTYYWAARAKAYDIFNTAHGRRVRELRALEVEDDHFTFASRIMDMCKMYLSDNEEELVETLTPKAFIDLLKTAVQMQRISVHLPANGPSGKDESQVGGSMELIMRTVAQQMNGGQLQSANAMNEAKQGTTGRMEQIKANPEMLKMAQELIIRMTVGPNQGTQH